MRWTWRGSCCVVAVLLGACDPVHDDAVAGLGGEVGNVRPGPLHRPGQACLLCHDGALGDPSQFSVAGTVFLRLTGTEPARAATVELTAADGSKFNALTNAAGNFYITPRQWSPKFPLQSSVTFGGDKIAMVSQIGLDGSCGGCHRETAGPDSPGRVYVMLDDGGVPQ
jgi:hypothetical protein